MEKFNYFGFNWDSDYGTIIEEKDGKLTIEKNRFCDFMSNYYSERLVELIKKCDVNHLLKFEQVEFADEKYSSKKYYRLSQVPMVKCINLEKNLPLIVNEFSKGHFINYEISNIEDIQKINKMSDKYPAFQLIDGEYGIKNLGFTYFKELTRKGSELAVLDESMILPEQRSPLFKRFGFWELYCTAELVKECRKEGMTGIYFVGKMSNSTEEGETDGAIAFRVSDEIKQKYIDEKDEKESLDALNELIDKTLKKRKMQQYKAVLIGLFDNAEGYISAYTAGCKRNTEGWEDECDEPMEYCNFPERIQSGEALYLVNQALYNRKADFGKRKLLFGFDKGGVYEVIKIK